MKIKENIYTILFILTLIIFGVSLVSQIEKETEYVSVEVKPGDTIWGFAEELEEHHNLSTNEFIKWVKNANFVFDGTIKVGQTLLLPIQETKLTERELGAY
jgi:cell division protein YceG involved in septum cleavage